MRWQELAACAGQTELMFDTERTAEALQICNGCPVFAECRAADEASLVGFNRDHVFGVMAGRIQEQRRNLISYRWRPGRGELRERKIQHGEYRPRDAAAKAERLARMVSEWQADPTPLTLRDLSHRFAIGQPTAQLLYSRLKEAS